MLGSYSRLLCRWGGSWWCFHFYHLRECGCLQFVYVRIWAAWPWVAHFNTRKPPPSSPVWVMLLCYFAHLRLLPLKGDCMMSLRKATHLNLSKNKRCVACCALTSFTPPHNQLKTCSCQFEWWLFPNCKCHALWELVHSLTSAVDYCLFGKWTKNYKTKMLFVPKQLHRCCPRVDSSGAFAFSCSFIPEWSRSRWICMFALALMWHHMLFLM